MAAECKAYRILQSDIYSNLDITTEYGEVNVSGKLGSQPVVIAENDPWPPVGCTVKRMASTFAAEDLQRSYRSSPCRDCKRRFIGRFEKPV